MTLSREDRITGCLLGGALGDALGSPFEGSGPRHEFAIPDDLRVSDDTQLTIATCESIVESASVDPERVAAQFVRWFRERRIAGIGASTLKALAELDAGGHWAMAGASGERSAGNGAAMRIAPLAFFLDPDIDAQRQTIRDVCRITHRNDEAYVGALAILRMIRHVVSGGRPDAGAIQLLVDGLPDSRLRDRLMEMGGSTDIESYAERFATTGYVVDSVPLAILASTQAADVMDTMQRLVRCGGDVDTIASMFGQIFGAAYGAGALPIDIINRIDAAPLVRETAARLAHVSIAT